MPLFLGCVSSVVYKYISFPHCHNYQRWWSRVSSKCHMEALCAKSTSLILQKNAGRLKFCNFQTMGHSSNYKTSKSSVPDKGDVKIVAKKENQTINQGNQDHLIIRPPENRCSRNFWSTGQSFSWKNSLKKYKGLNVRFTFIQSWWGGRAYKFFITYLGFNVNI